ncbi:hypothetical protein JQN58_19730 [Aneurinibacillus sp. BA2021]|nr:hypothetical protein [Aneurinibacillus sp. BA2021]
MNALRQTLTQNVGKWTVLHTKSGAVYGKVESINSQGVTVLLPAHYSFHHPSVRLVEDSVKGAAKDVHAAQVFFRRPFFRRPFFFRRFFFPFGFFNPFFFPFFI